MVAQLKLGIPPEGVGKRKIRIKLNGPVKVRYGTTIVAQEALGNPPVVVGFRMVGIKFNDLVKIRYGTLIIALNELGIPRLNERVIRRVGARADSERNGKDGTKGYRYEFLEHQVILPKIVST